MALIDDMREMSRLMGEILIASDKFLKEYTAKEAKRNELQSATNGTYSESKDTHDERGNGNVTVEAFAPKRVS